MSYVELSTDHLTLHPTSLPMTAPFSAIILLVVGYVSRFHGISVKDERSLRFLMLEFSEK